MAKLDLNSIIKDATLTALDFYDSRGISINYIPKVKYTDEFFALNHNGAATINMTKVLEKYNPTTLTGFISKKKSLDANKDLVKRFGEFDILLFKPFTYVLNSTYPKNIPKSIFVHEIEHLIERDKGILVMHNLVNEGSAVYCENLFIGSRFPLESNDIIGLKRDYYIRYILAANLLHFEMSKNNHPFKMLFDISLRSKIEKDILNALRIDPTLRD
jgi:hypothetical protein